ncbi:MAG: hypothetical protein AAF637_07345 [Pseudomonadota bacterium]
MLRRAHSWAAAGIALAALQTGAASPALGDSASADPAKRGSWFFSCDPARFESEPHYVKVRMNDDRVTSIHLLRTADGDEVVTSHPYGSARAIVTDDTRELCMKLRRLDRFVDRIERRQRLLAWLERGRRLLPPLPGARAPQAVAAAAPGDSADYNTVLLIGWNDSTGQTPGECYNFTTGAPAENVGSLNFSSDEAARSTAAQTRISATVSGGFAGFRASDTFSYSDQWQSSANSGSAYFNISSIWTLNNTVDPSNPLTDQGKDAGDQFATLCGVRYMASVQGGLVATLAVAYGSSSQDIKKSIDDKFTASFELDSISAAVGVSSDLKVAASYLTVRLFHQGGGVKASSLLTSAFGATNSSGEAYVDLCASLDKDSVTDCDTFIGNMTKGATDAGNAFNALAQDVEAGEDLSFLALFPNGVAGVEVSTLVTATAETKDDVLAPYEDQLQQYLKLLNEIATLGNRAKHVDALVRGDFNPDILDLAGYLGRLIDSNEGAVSYAATRAILIDDLGACLAATSDNVKDACAPIIDGGETVASAYAWYDADHGYPACTSGANKDACWLAQQNTIALQYAAIVNEVGFTEHPNDVLYVDVLPPFSDAFAAPISGKAAFVAFVDRPWIDFPGTRNIRETVPDVSILALKNDTDLAEIYTSIEPPQTSSGSFEWFGIVRNVWHEQTGNRFGAQTNWTTRTCTPTFSSPCPIGFEWDANNTVPVVNQQANGINNMFTAD